jgi:hypothetical protein
MFVSPDMDIIVPELTPLYDDRMTKVLSPVVIQENRRAGKLEPAKDADNIRPGHCHRRPWPLTV